MLRWCWPTVRTLGGHGSARSSISSTSNGFMPKVHRDDPAAKKSRERKPISPKHRSFDAADPRYERLSKLINSPVGLVPSCERRPSPHHFTAGSEPSTHDLLTSGGSVKHDCDHPTSGLTAFSNDHGLVPMDVQRAPTIHVNPRPQPDILPPMAVSPSHHSHPQSPMMSGQTKSLGILGDFLLPRNLSSASPQEHSANTLRSLYVSVKHRSQLRHLTASQMSELLSLFGSLSLPNPRPQCIFMNKFVSHMEERTFRTYWPFVLQIARDKEQLGQPLNGKDRYWIMRAQLAKLDTNHDGAQENADDCAMLRSRAMAQATTQYHRIYQHTPDSEVHVPYFQALLSFHTPEHLAELVPRLCKVLLSCNEPDSRLMKIIWHLILRRGHDLPTKYKELLLSSLLILAKRPLFPRLIPNHMDGMQVSTLATTGSTPGSRIGFGITDLAATLTSVVFPPFSKLVPSPIRRWAINQAPVALSPDNHPESRWNNLLLLALYNAPAEQSQNTSPDNSSNDPDSGIVDWRTIFVLATLEKTMKLKPLSPQREDSKGLQDFVRTLWRTWKSNVGNVSTPPLVARAIVAAFFRMSVTTTDLQLKNACHRYCLDHDLWIEGDPSKASKLQTRDLIVEYIVASFRLNGNYWPEIYSALSNTLPGTTWQADVLDAAIRHFIRLDADIAYGLYQFASSNNIHLSGDLIHSLGVTLASSKPLDLITPFLSNPCQSRGQTERLLGAILRPLGHTRYLSSRHAGIIAEVMWKLYIKVPPPLHFRGRIRHVLPVLAASGLASKALAIVESIHRASPSYFTPSFFYQFTRTLLRHRQFRNATRLLQLVDNFPSPSRVKLRRMLTLSLARSGAHRHSRRVYRTAVGRGVWRSTQESLTRAVDFRPHSPARLLALRVVPLLTRSLSHDTTISYALSILVRARRLLAARKLLERTYKHMDSITRTRHGNIILHGLLLSSSSRNGRLVRHILRTTDFLVRKYDFVRDRVTVNILLKAVLRWRHVIDSPKLKALFDHMIRGGYPAAIQFRRRGVPFGTPPNSSTIQLPTLPPFISFERHVRPMYKMFIKAFHNRSDVRAAATVVGILRAEEMVVLRRREARDRARLLGRLRANESLRRGRKMRVDVNSLP